MGTGSAVGSSTKGLINLPVGIVISSSTALLTSIAKLIHYSNTTNLVEYEKINPKNKKLVKIIKGTCSICGRNKSQIFTK